jgi:hypothetical protein
MSSPWNRQESHSAMAAPDGVAGAALNGRAWGSADGMDEWDLLRSSPDYDREEMQGVTLPGAYTAALDAWPAPPWASPGSPQAGGAWLDPVAASGASGAGRSTPASASWLQPPGGSEVGRPTPASVSSPSPRGGEGSGEGSPPAPPAVATPVERWPEAAGVANLASDLFTGADGEGLWSPMAADSVVFSAGCDDDEEGLDWAAILARAEEVSAEADGPLPVGSTDTSASWVFLPDAMIQNDGSGVDLLDEALHAGAKAGLLNAGCQMETAGSEPRALAQNGLPDVLEAALTAGKRAGLMRSVGEEVE